MHIVKKAPAASPWLALISFVITVVVATVERWSAQDLAWSFWLAGLIFGLIYLIVYHWAQGDRETLVPYLFFWLFFYFLFAGFLDLVFAWIAWETTGADMPPLLASVPAAVAHAARQRWPFLVTGGIALLPDYILDARTVNFTDWSKPLIGRDFLRMVALVFLLMLLTILQAGIFALYAILLVYFLPWDSLRRLARVLRELPSVIGRQGLGLLVLIVALGGSGAGAISTPAAQVPDATITVDATEPGSFVESGLWGSNLTNLAPAAGTVEHAGFVTATRQIGITVIRWPGGNNASAYDWKRNEMIKPGRRVPQPDGVDMSRILEFAREVGAELSITVNFGTMTAQDAADLVEFLNGPADSLWGAKRAAMGFPEPLNVRYFEIGNEEKLRHMWYFSWTAENPHKYFFGGEEERRGFYGGSVHDPVGAKGDFFKARGVGSKPRSTAEWRLDGTPLRYVPDYEQAYPLRFPPVRDVRVFWAASREDAESRIFEEWVEVTDLGTQPADAKVFALDAEAGILYFGDGVHGAMPSADSYFLVEYTTYGHEGFVDFARAMRAAPSSVPIQIGAAMLPFQDGEPITDTVHMQEIFAEMDFYVRHQYDGAFPPRTYGVYQNDRQIAADRVDILTTVYQRVQQYVAGIGMTDSPEIGVTEWNVYLNDQHWHINRTLEGGVIAAEWFIRLLNAGQAAPVAFANQFALHGGNLALIRSQTNHSIAPMGYVFQGFSNWAGSRVVSTTVTSPEALAYDVTVPFVAATAALSADGRTLRLAVVNNAETTELTATLQITGFTPSSARLWRLSAERYDADNEHDPTNVVLREEPAPIPLTILTLPPHSVTFVELHAPSRETCVGDANGNGIGDVADIETTASQAGCRVYLPLAIANWRRPWPTPSAVDVRDDEFGQSGYRGLGHRRHERGGALGQAAGRGRLRRRFRSGSRRGHRRRGCDAGCSAMGRVISASSGQVLHFPYTSLIPR